MKKLKSKGEGLMKRNIKSLINVTLCVVCAITMVFAGTPAKNAQVYGREQSGKIAQPKTVSAYSAEEPTEEPTAEPVTEIPTEEPTTEGPTTEEITTEELTEEPTEEPTTEEPTTEQPTTKPQGVKPWGKNKKGQFVNGNLEVIPGAKMKGIDVSKWNGEIDWSKVAKSDVDYAIIRCGFGSNIMSQDDIFWNRNVTECEKYKIPYGVYIYSYATNIKQAKSEAKHVLRLIKGHKLNFPIYYDMEDKCQAQLSATRRKNIANTFFKTISEAGYECGIYANLNWWNNYIPKSIVGVVDYKWVAQYNDNACTYLGTYQMWQCTSVGKVDGIKGNVDLNFWFGKVRTRGHNIKMSEPKATKFKSVRAGKKKAVVRFKKITGAKGYKIQYSKTKKFKSKATKTITTKKTALTIKKLTPGKVYYFRVKPYKNRTSDIKIYAKEWSNVKKTKIKR